MAKDDFPHDDQLRQAVLETVSEAVLANLSSQEQADALDIRVGVLNAVAHLGGSLPSLYLWELAQETAAQVPGIRGVVNRIAAPGAPAPSRIIHLDLPPGCSLKES